jgi:hypothetical protein
MRGKHDQARRKRMPPTPHAHITPHTPVTPPTPPTPATPPRPGPKTRHLTFRVVLMLYDHMPQHVPSHHPASILEGDGGMARGMSECDG